MVDLFLYFFWDIIKYYLLFGGLFVVLFFIIEVFNEEFTLDFTDNLGILFFWPVILSHLINRE